MKLTFVISALTALAAALPGGSPGGYGDCLSQAAAEKLVAEYAAVIAQQPSDLGGPVKTARAITAAGYSETSDSANIQLGIPVSTLKSLYIFTLVALTGSITARCRDHPI